MRSRERNRRCGKFGALLASLALSTVCAAEPSLTVAQGARTAIFTGPGMLALPGATTIAVPADPVYRVSTSLRAVPLASLLPGAAADDTIRFMAGDRLLASLPAAQLLANQPSGPVAYLAVEPADAPWPPLKPGEAVTAGPFRLVWLRADKTVLAPELWPVQLSRIDEIQPLSKRYPMILPAASVAANHPIRAGFTVFQKQCMTCHTLNGGGDSTLGPDLNIPYNPTEYLRPEALRRLVRDPQSLRRWPGSKMPAFDARTLSDRELAELMAYLRHMADRKVAPPVAK
jgi:mono/diheme cytochrome c family protein